MQEKISAFFSSIAPSYDRMNDILSFGCHPFWKAYFVEHLPWATLPDPFVVLDMACGSGDIGALMLQKADLHGKGIQPLFVDPNPDMLALGQQRLVDPRIVWMVESAECLSLAEGTIDLYTIAFGLRNVQNRKQSLAEAFRVLKEGGSFFCLEFSTPNYPLLGCAYHGYLRLFPLLGKIFAKQADPYRYLAQSIRDFPSPSIIAMEMTQAGFREVDYKNLSSGIVAIHWGIK